MRTFSLIAASLLVACGPSHEAETPRPDAGTPRPKPSPTPTPTPTYDLGQPPDLARSDAADTPDLAPGRVGACAGATTPIYAFVDGANPPTYSYSTEGATPAGLSPLGVVFRLLPASTSTTPLYLLHSDQAADNLLSTNAQEGSSLGYKMVATLGNVASAAENGSVRLLRFVHPSPLRHFETTDAAAAPTGYMAEASPPTGYACAP